MFMTRITLTFFLLLFAINSRAGDALAPLPKPVLCGKFPKVIDESSGLVKSRRYPDKDVFWTHNDSGDTARIFAVTSKGAILRIVKIPHAENVDWEEISMDEKGRLVICDIGDNKRDNNGGKRDGVILYRIAEPDAFDPAEPAPEPEIFRFNYPQGEGPFDAEGVFMSAGSAYLLTKRLDRTTCYKLPLPEKVPAEMVPMTRIARTKSFTIATGAALSDDGRHLAIINYHSITVITFAEPFASLKPNEKDELPLFDSPRRTLNVFLGQTEAVAWDSDDLLLTTEGGDIFRCAKCK